jgi:predicted nucleotidyltransferase
MCQRDCGNWRRESEFDALSETDHGRIVFVTLTKPDNLRIDLPLDALADICRRFGVSHLAIFGSAMREDFDADSDVDFLVRFINNDSGPWMHKLNDLEAALSALLDRKVDVVSWRGIEKSTNPYRRAHILNNARMVYAEG